MRESILESVKRQARDQATRAYEHDLRWRVGQASQVAFDDGYGKGMECGLNRTRLSTLWAFVGGLVFASTALLTFGYLT